MKSDQSRAMLAVLISGIILFTWQFYFAPPAKNNLENNKNTQEKIPNQEVTVNQTKNLPKEEIKNINEESFQLVNNDFTYTISNSLKILEAKYLSQSAKELFQNNNSLAQIQFVSNDSAKTELFQINKLSNQKVNLSNSNLSLDLILNDNGLLDINVLKNNGFSHYKFLLPLKDIKKNNIQFSKFTYLTNDHDLEEISISDEENINQNIQWFGSEYYYHTLNFILGKDKKVKITSKVKDTASQLEAITPITENISFIFVKKTYDQLIKIGKNLHFSVDFGFFSVIAVPILRGLQYFYSLVPNWGWAIVLLTFLIRFLTFPLQYISTKNMAKMKKIQPEIDRIKKKYKDDPAKMQKETMQLFKRAGTNPMSGCFPMLLQMPIFFAFYTVLYNAVELVDAPWIGWVKDLSSKDPYYVLPILMGVAMFAQQKITPTTGMDKTQAKVMMFLPLIFAFIMKDLPSGLNLYIFVSTLFGIALHFFVLKRVKA